jgi:RNA polymerase sigma-70 factor (sigma-E family)
MRGMNGVIAERAIGVFEPSRSRLDRLGEWFSAEYSGLLRFAYFLTGDAGTAEDLVHDAFVRLYRADRHIEASGFRAYARRTIVNLNNSRFRRSGAERKALTASVTSDVSNTPEPTDHVWRAIMALPKGQRACVALRYYEDLSEQEIADTLGVSTGTVKKQMNRAMSALRLALGDRSES